MSFRIFDFVVTLVHQLLHNTVHSRQSVASVCGLEVCQVLVCRRFGCKLATMFVEFKHHTAFTTHREWQPRKDKVLASGGLQNDQWLEDHGLALGYSFGCSLAFCSSFSLAFSPWPFLIVSSSS